MILPLVALLAILPQAAQDADVFIGTLERDGDVLQLRRCDLAEHRYVLVEAAGGHALADVRKARLPAYGEVIGHVVEHGDTLILQVARVEKLTPGKSCHLADLLSG